MNRTFERVATLAISRIRKEQNPDGSFTSLSSTDPYDFSDALPRRTTFFTSNILIALARSGHCPEDIKKKGLQFLLSERSARWSFNYWSRSASDASLKSYPDDLDDTFAALAAIALCAPGTLGGAAFAEIVKMLTERETRAGGPYRTWLYDGCGTKHIRRDIDIAVNSTIGYFFALNGVQLAGINLFIGKQVRKNLLASPYYPGPLQVAYLITRFFKRALSITDDARTALSLIVKRFEPSNIVELAMATCMQRSEELMSNLVEAIGFQGFPPSPFCIDPARDGKRSYAGSGALTAALCMEALAACTKPTPQKRIPVRENIHARIQTLALSACDGIDGSGLRKTARERIEATSDTRITHPLYEFKDALRNQGISLTDAVVDDLAIANLYGWMAYTIYDRAMDEKTEIGLIPCANYFLRELAGIYGRLSVKIPDISRMFAALMNRIDDANIWEFQNCRAAGRIPDFGAYQNLAHRSIGHAAGPLAMILYAGYGSSSKEYSAVYTFFLHYLIARQLNDDAHDWTHDLACGQTNSVAAIVLRSTDGGDPTISHLKEIFWKTSIDAIVKLVRNHIETARTARENCTLIRGSNFLEGELDALSRAAEKALRERDRTADFLRHYKAKTSSGGRF